MIPGIPVKLRILIALVILQVYILSLYAKTDANPTQDSMEISSPTFKNNSEIPIEYTCESENISPPLLWSKLPEKTKSLALIVDDPDAPSKTFAHWVIYNIPPTEKKLKKNFPTKASFLSNETLQGRNDMKSIGYSGPCPPSGAHHYFFKLYALDSMLNTKSGLSKKELLKAMDGHILAKAQLIGIYSKKIKE